MFLKSLVSLRITIMYSLRNPPKKLKGQKMEEERKDKRNIIVSFLFVKII